MCARWFLCRIKHYAYQALMSNWLRKCISPLLLKQIEELDVNLKFVVKVGTAGVLLVRHLLLGFFAIKTPH